MPDPSSTNEASVAGLPPNRIETLVDGVFAVAMTILVLELHVPEAPGDLVAALWHLWPKVASYAVGFVILGTLWVGHHYQFHYIKRSDRTLIWINIVFLLAISFLPFAIGLIGSHGAERVSCIVYGATVNVAGACLLAQWLYATQNGRLTGRAASRAVVAALRGRVLLGTFVYGAGLAVAFVSAKASLVVYAAMPLVYLLPGKIDAHVRPESAP